MGAGGVISNPKKFIANLRKFTHIYKKSAMKFPKIRSGGIRPFGLFSKKKHIWGDGRLLVTVYIGMSSRRLDMFVGVMRSPLQPFVTIRESPSVCNGIHLPGKYCAHRDLKISLLALKKSLGRRVGDVKDPIHPDSRQCTVGYTKNF